MVWNVAGLAAGTAVTLNFQIRLDGSTGVNTTVLQGGTAGGYRIYEWDLRFYANADLSGVGYHAVTNSDQPDHFGVYDFSTRMVVGAPMTLSLFGSVAASGTGRCRMLNLLGPVLRRIRPRRQRHRFLLT